MAPTWDDHLQWVGRILALEDVLLLVIDSKTAKDKERIIEKYRSME